MNKIESKFNLKTFFVFLTVLVLTLSMAFATACSKGGSTSTSESVSASDSTSSESTSEEEAKDDTQLFANGDFEHPTNKKPSSTPITLSSSSTKWTGSVDGEVGYQINSSDVKRGIISVAEADFTKLGSDYKEAVNPQTPYLAGKLQDNADSDADETGNRILMLRNKDYAAQYVTSATSLSVPAGSYGKLSVWVRTSEIESYTGAGAYIKVRNTVTSPSEEGVTYDPLVIENINTPNKEWVEYVIYLAPNACKATSFTLSLGLGEGNKFDVEKHVKGFAYFDNISFELIDAAAYGAAVADQTVAINTADFTLEGRVNSDKLVVKYDLSEGTATPLDIGGSGEYLDYKPNGNDLATGKKTDLVDNVITIDFSNLVTIGSAYTHTSDVFTLNPSSSTDADAISYARISFWAKIDAEDYQTKATITLYDVLAEKDVVSFANVSTKGHEDKFHDDFARFTFYVANNFVGADDDMQYQIKFSFGPTDANSISDVKLLPTGTAVFKDFEIEKLTKENYDLANTSTDTRAKKGSLIGTYDSDYVAPDDEEEEDDDTPDSYNVNLSGYGKTLLEDGQIVSLEELTSSNLVRSKETAENSATIGVVNSKYATADNDNYPDVVKDALTAVKGKELGNNKNVQALLIHNNRGNNYVSGNVISIAKNSTYVFSIRVYAHEEAKAFVKLFVVQNTDKGEALPAYETTVTKYESEKFIDGFATVTFIITSGIESFDVRLQFGVNGEDKVALFQSVLTGSANTTYTSAEVVKSIFADDYTFAGDVKEPIVTTYYASEDHVGDSSLILKDDDGNNRVETSSKKEIKSTYATVGTAAKLIIYNRLDLDDRFVIEAPEAEESTSESVVESGAESTEGGNLGWLQVTSIIIALVLVVALIAVVVRKSTESKTKKKKATEKYYQGFDKNKHAKGNVAVPDEDDKAKDYDYDNPDNN
ncbi:MAG: hypothetical protein IKA61_02575 [Clostridia bacterium]|nr:hypothetical protein [Clostridia bacterium]